MGVDRSFIPITAALVVAIVGAVVLYRMDFGAKNGVQPGALNMITAATVDRAGATAAPTERQAQP